MTQRTRSKGALTMVPMHYEDANRTCTDRSVKIYPDIDSGLSEGSSTIMTDVVTPNYRERSAAGEVIISPFQSVTTTQKITAGAFTRELYAGMCSPVIHYYQNLIGPWALNSAKAHLNPGTVFSSGTISDMETEAATKCWSNANGHDAGVLEDVAQYRQLLKMLHDPLQRANSWVYMFQGVIAKKGGWKSAREKSEWISSMWLQYQYGIRPIISTVNAIIKNWEMTDEKKRRSPRGSSGGTDVIVRPPLVITDTRLSFVFSQVDTEVATFKCGLLFEDSLTFQQKLGIDASGMLALPFQLVTLSFVSDWFFNVEKFLQAAIPYLKSSQLGGWTTHHRTLHRETTCVGTVDGTYHALSIPAEQAAVTISTKRRTVGVKNPGIVYRPLSFSSFFGKDTRTLDAMALLVQRLKKFKV